MSDNLRRYRAIHQAEPSMFEAESLHRYTETRLLPLLCAELFRLKLSRCC